MPDREDEAAVGKELSIFGIIPILPVSRMPRKWTTRRPEGPGARPFGVRRMMFWIVSWESSTEDVAARGMEAEGLAGVIGNSLATIAWVSGVRWAMP